MKKVVVHGCYHTRNFGDILMLDLIGRRLNAKKECTVSSPWLHENELGNIDVEYGGGIKGCFLKDVAILGGGGYLVDEEGDSRSTQRLLRYSVPARIWRIFNVPYSIVGVGVGPELTARGAKRVRYICDGAKNITVRDDESKALLVEIGVNEAKIAVTADFVMGLTKNDIPAGFVIKAKNLLASCDKTKRKFGLHISVGQNKAHIIENIAIKLAKGLGENSDAQIVWLFDHSIANLDIIKNINSKYFKDAVIIDKQDHWTTVALLSELDAVLTTKLHVGITSWALGVSPCSLANHGKTKRFYRQIDREDFHTSLSENNTVVSEWGRMFVEEPEAFNRDNLERRKKYSALSKSNFDIVEKFIDLV